MRCPNKRPALAKTVDLDANAAKLCRAKRDVVAAIHAAVTRAHATQVVDAHPQKNRLLLLHDRSERNLSYRKRAAPSWR